ncbi:hypothetical protein [Mycobacterium parascrofulaceum]|uniref:hypothetical protein n=1 Tax=Mycobacterium parascrofulaceum TaxID=240125 RepID=UPI0012F4C819|nr:hypothetical protein [Mycobacterium parascrofulaceum]
MTNSPSTETGIYGVSPSNLQQQLKSRTRHLCTLAALLVLALTVGSAATLIDAPPAQATCNSNCCGDIPEWYQFCKNRTPGGTFSDQTHFIYKGAPANASGVDCKYDYAGFGGFVPRTKVIHYSWSQVCSDLRIGKRATWDGHVAHCKP